MGKTLQLACQLPTVQWWLPRAQCWEFFWDCKAASSTVGFTRYGIGGQGKGFFLRHCQPPMALQIPHRHNPGAISSLTPRRQSIWEGQLGFLGGQVRSEWNHSSVHEKTPYGTTEPKLNLRGNDGNMINLRAREKWYGQSNEVSGRFSKKQ